MKKGLLLLAAVLLPVGGVVVYSCPPTEYDFYPKCLLHTLTGLHCPGCGGTRCVYALLHGNLPQALAYNALVVLALPFLTLWAGRLGYRKIRGQPVVTRPLPTWFLRVVLGVMLVYFVLRNLGFPPFSLLAPHQL